MELPFLRTCHAACSIHFPNQACVNFGNAWVTPKSMTLIIFEAGLCQLFHWSLSGLSSGVSFICPPISGMVVVLFCHGFRSPSAFILSKSCFASNKFAICDIIYYILLVLWMLLLQIVSIINCLLLYYLSQLVRICNGLIYTCILLIIGIIANDFCGNTVKKFM